MQLSVLGAALKPRVVGESHRCRHGSRACSQLSAFQPLKLYSVSDKRTGWTSVVVAAASMPQKSFDGDEQLDTDLADELSRFKSADAFQKMADHLDLVWKIGRSRGGRSPCSCCSGTGKTECRWCNGTGAMMIGDTLFRSKDGGSHCPVCKGVGELACENCRGTGYRAGWMQGPDECRT